MDLEIGENSIIMNREDAVERGLNAGDRVRLFLGPRARTVIVHLSSTFVSRGEIGIFASSMEEMGLKPGDTVRIAHAERPASIDVIKKKMRGEKLSREEIFELVRDIVDDNLTDVELTAYVVSVQTMGMDMDEIAWLTEAMVRTGDTLDFEGEIFDVHSIGGVPGNKYALIAVPTAAAAGLRIPKTSSRAISSAAGTADVMEVLARVDLSLEKIKEIVETVGATLAWGGAVNLAPADDKIIRVEYPLGIDPRPQLLASVMAKKKAMGANVVVIDIPMGEEAKVENYAEARKLARDFIELGERLGMMVDVAITYGGQPVGKAIGPALEAKEALMALEGKPVSSSLIEKSTAIAGILLELGGKARRGEGKAVAKEILRSGRSREKFLEIIEAQGSRGIESSEEVPVGKYHEDVTSMEDGYVGRLSNKALVRIARIAGSPRDKGAGIWLNKKKGDRVEKGDVLFTIYSSSRERLEMALRAARRLMPHKIEGMILERIPSYHEEG